MLLDSILIILLLLALPRGYHRGFTDQLSKLLAFVIGVIVAKPLSIWLCDLVGAGTLFGKAPWIPWLITFLLASGVALILLTYLLSGLRILLGVVDKLAGALLALLTTALILALLLQVYTSIGKKYQWTPIPATSQVSPILEEVGKTLLPYRLFNHKNEPQEEKFTEEEEEEEEEPYSLYNYEPQEEEEALDIYEREF